MIVLRDIIPTTGRSKVVSDYLQAHGHMLPKDKLYKKHSSGEKYLSRIMICFYC